MQYISYCNHIYHSTQYSTCLPCTLLYHTFLPVHFCLFASPYTILASHFSLVSPFAAAPLCALASLCLTYLSMHLNIPIATAAYRFTFPLHSILAHEALCILCYVSVPYSSLADLIISAPLLARAPLFTTSQFMLTIAYPASISLSITPISSCIPCCHTMKQSSDTAPSCSLTQRHSKNSQAISKG